MPAPAYTRMPALALTGILLAITATAFAHQTIVVGEEGEQYRVIVGMVREPVFTDERNGLDLIVRRMDDEPVPGLETSLTATFIAPGGQERRLALRPQWGRPGHYTDDIILTATGTYRIRVSGFIGGVEVDETFATHEVRSLSDLAFP